jgi:hypothetical protein
VRPDGCWLWCYPNLSAPPTLRCDVCQAMGSSVWMPGRRPWKVDCADGSTASDVAAVVVSLFGHVDGVEWTVGVPGVGGASALAAPRSRFGGLTRGQRAARVSRAVRGFFRAKAQRQRRRCLWVSLPSWGRRCGYPLRAMAPGENP